MHTFVRRVFTLIALISAFVVFAAGCSDDPQDGTSPSPSVSRTSNSDCSIVADAPTPGDTLYDALPDMTIDSALAYTATVGTVRGDITIELLPDLAPETVNSFVFLARDGFYDGVAFNRVEPGFLVQAGDPNGSAGGPGFNTPAEYSSEPFVRGAMGMTRSNDPEDRGSKWFITTEDAPNLDGQFTLFARVTSGMDVVDCIQGGDQIVTVTINEA